MTSSVVILAVSLFIVAGINGAKVPSTWRTCKRNLPPAEYETCIHSAVEGAINELLTKGTPSLGIPKLNPLKITSLEIGQGDGPVAVDLKFKDLELGNLDSVVIKDIRHKDAENYRFGADIELKKSLTVKAKYDLSGKVLVLPIKGNGDCNLVMDNVKASVNFVGTSFKKGEETYVNITDFIVDFDTDKLHMKFENLFDGNKQLGDNMNTFLNENWDQILKELKPAVVEAFTQAFKSVTNQIFHKVPYQKLVPAK